MTAQFLASGPDAAVSPEFVASGRLRHASGREQVHEAALECARAASRPTCRCSAAAAAHRSRRPTKRECRNRREFKVARGHT